MQNTETSKHQDDWQKREEVAQRNYDALVGLMSEHRLTIPAREMATWRPTIRTEGNIPGIDRNLTCVATNGLLAFFTHPDFPVLLGHVRNFEWLKTNDSGEQKTGCPPALFSMPKKVATHGVGQNARRPRAKKPSALEQAMELLRKHAEGLGR